MRAGCRPAHVVGDMLGFWGRSLPWMAVLAVVLIGARSCCGIS
jgi:hypothetical protein